MSNGKTHAIEISFKEPVTLSDEEARELHELIGRICKRYSTEHPGRVMWAAGYGFKMLSNPFLVGDDEPLQFDDGIQAFECFEREDFDWRCTKCGHKQGDHKNLILDPPAGNCDFEPRMQQGRGTEKP